MKQIFFIQSILLSALLLFNSCADLEIEAPIAGNNIEIPEGYYFVLDTDVPQSRVAYTDINHSYFEEGDLLGIYAIDEKGALMPGQPTNAEYRVMNVTNVATGNVRQVLENVNPGERVERGYRYVIYYPYIENMTFDYLKSLSYGVQYNQNETSISHGSLHQALTGYEASDLLWDVAEDEIANDGNTHYVNIQMDHVMANIILNVSEEYLASVGNNNYEVYVLNTPRRVEGANLTESLTDTWSYTTTRTASSYRPIQMWYSGIGTSGALQFRAAIPACQTIPSQTAFLQVPTSDGVKQFKLKNDLALRPGKNYIFTIQEGSGTEQPELSDDDSWVLDVLDPETGEPVGLLCREYLHYQPHHTGITQQDEKTGTMVPVDGINKKCINSQAWVFYNLMPGTTIPNLGKGTVLRFIYDIHMNYNQGIDVVEAEGYWPLPHSQGDMVRHQGLFTPEHGFKWVQNPNNDYGVSSNEIGGEETKHFMHGGTIVWNGQSNKISDFIEPKNLQIDYTIAKNNGHIAINGENITVNYSAVTGNKDAKGNKVGVLIPHYLIDQRQTEVTRYPLVKIGYNQFWISKPFKAKIFTDGTPIMCYNQIADNNSKPADVTFQSSESLGAGYIYPFTKDLDGPSSTKMTYDPINDNKEMAGYTVNGSVKFEPAPLYNKAAVEDDRFVPVSNNSDYYYIMPTSSEIVDLTTYYGFLFAAKMCTREIAQKKGTDFVYDQYTAITRGETSDSGKNADMFTANISGFNLRTLGAYDPSNHTYSSLGSSACMILDSKQHPKGIDYLEFTISSAWRTDFKVRRGDNEQPNDYLLQENQYAWSNVFANQFFAQVRLLMKYRNQADTGGSRSLHSSFTHIHPQKACNVYVPLEAME